MDENYTVETSAVALKFNVVFTLHVSKSYYNSNLSLLWNFNETQIQPNSNKRWYRFMQYNGAQ